MSVTPKRKPGRTPELALTVQYATRCAHVPTLGKLERWARSALRKRANVTLRLIGMREARELNRKYRGRDYATNVLTFIYSERGPVAGDVAICAPVVAREARRDGKHRDAHYAHLTVHGMLHLQGFDHARAPAAKRMENLETRILAGLGYADPYRGDVQPAKKARPKAAAPHRPRLKSARKHVR